MKWVYAYEIMRKDEGESRSTTGNVNTSKKLNERNTAGRHLLKTSGSATCSLVDLALPAYRPNSLGVNVDMANQSPHVSRFSRSVVRQTGGSSVCNASTDKGARRKRKETETIFQGLTS